MVWCGLLKGLHLTILSFRIPATLCIFVISIASSKLNGGRIETNLLASIVFPEPGEPIIRRLWKPAAAISRAFFTAYCPFTSAKSPNFSRLHSKTFSKSTCSGCFSKSPFKKSSISFRFLKP